MAEDVGIGFAGVDGAAGDGDAFGLASGYADEFDNGFGEFVGGVGFHGCECDIFLWQVGIAADEIGADHSVEGLQGLGWFHGVLF